MAARTTQQECGWHVRSKCSWLHIYVKKGRAWEVMNHRVRPCSEAISSPTASGPINDGYMHWFRQNLHNIVCCKYRTFESINYPRDARAETVHAVDPINPRDLRTLKVSRYRFRTCTHSAHADNSVTFCMLDAWCFCCRLSSDERWRTNDMHIYLSMFHTLHACPFNSSACVPMLMHACLYDGDLYCMAASTTQRGWGWHVRS